MKDMHFREGFEKFAAAENYDLTKSEEGYYTSPGCTNLVAESWNAAVEFCKSQQCMSESFTIQALLEAAREEGRREVLDGISGYLRKVSK